MASADARHRGRRLLAAALAVGLALGVPGPAAAVDARTLERARGAYEVGEYEQVITLLQASVRPPSRGARPSGTREDRIEAHLLLARSLFITYEHEAAKRECLEVLKLDPEHRLDPAYTLPKFLALFEQVRDANGWIHARFPAAVEATVPARDFPIGTIWDPRAVPLWLLPPGVGQFLNRHTAKGVLFAGVEAGLFAGTAVTWAYLREGNRQVTTETYDTLVQVRTANQVLFGALVGTLAIGMVDALVFRDRPQGKRTRAPAPRERAAPPPAGAGDPGRGTAVPPPPR